jgi:hypothetical protein
MKTMFCKNCGKEIDDVAKFCENCGKPVEIASEAVNSETAPEPEQQPQAHWTPGIPTAETVQKKPVEEQAKDKIGDLQSKLDNSNNKFLKGKTVLDIAGLVAVAGMIISVFFPWIDVKLTYSNWTFVSQSYSVLNISDLAALSSSLSGITSTISLLFFLPLVYALMDLLMIKENSTRHVRLIVTSVFNFVLIGFVGSAISMLGTGVSLAAGFYLDCLFTLGLLAIGIVGVVQKRKKP